MERRPLGRSELEVTPLALGSWRTFERIPRERGAAVMRAAREAGIAFLDDARYNDETGTAPIPTGYSEVLFGELFRGRGLGRATRSSSRTSCGGSSGPSSAPPHELDGSLGRMGLDHVDLIYANPPPDGPAVRRWSRRWPRCSTAGKARAWGS